MSRSAGTTADRGRDLWRWVRLGAALLIIGLLLWRLGAGPFVEGLRQVDAISVAAALTITAMTTVVSAWRWRLIAGSLGLHLPLRAAVASYYRSQFLNSVVPGGFLGDLHRGVRHGREASDVLRGVRSVVWDRLAGQAVQIVLTTVVLLAVASRLAPAMAVIGVVSVATAVIVTLVVSARPRGSQSWAARLSRTVRDDLRNGVLARRSAPAICAASALVVAGHVGVFLVAARAEGSPASLRQLVPLGMVILLAMSVPASIGGWGPREGVAAWAFAVAGLGAERGLETATIYGVLSLLATVPGAVLLLSVRRAPGGPAPTTVNELVVSAAA